MKNDLLAKYAEDKNLNIKIIKVWKDSYSNLLVIFEALGKKYSAIGKDDPNSNDWSHFHGIGSSKKTTDMPAGRGDYLIGEKMLPAISEKIVESLESQAPQKEIINNKSGVSWAPKNKTEKDNLAALINKSEQINSNLSGIGMIYSGGDKLIYGEDVDASDVLNWTPPKEVQNITSNKGVPAPSISKGDETYWRNRFYDTVASQMGVPYYWGGDDPGRGFDCSGLIHWALDKSGLIPGAPDDAAAGQMRMGRPISQAELKKGDLIGFQTEKGTRHIGVYSGEGTSYVSALGGDQRTHGDNPNAKVKVSDFTRDNRAKYFASIDSIIAKKIGSKSVS